MKTHEEFLKEAVDRVLRSYGTSIRKCEELLAHYHQNYPEATKALEGLFELDPFDYQNKMGYYLAGYGELSSDEMKLFFSYLEEVLTDCPEDLPMLSVDPTIREWKRRLFTYALEHYKKEG